MINKIKNNPKYIVFIFTFLVVVIDRLSKFLVMTNLELAKEVSIIPNFFSLYYVTNTGAAFSSLENQRTLLLLATIFCIALITTMINKEEYKSKLTIPSLGLLLGGIISNFIDRLFYKEVIDFLSFTIFTYKYPVFNIADICIVLGAILYLIISLIEEIHEKKK